MMLDRILFCTLSAMLAFATVGLSKSATAQSLQRLFTTPEQRLVLDRRRARASQPDLVDEVTELIAEVIDILPLEILKPVDVVYALQGIVRRGDNHYTVWLNNEALDQQDLPENMELLAPYSQGRLRIHKPRTGEYFDVRPGQVLNLTRGELLESYQVSLEPETEDEVEAAPIVLPPTTPLENTPATDALDDEQRLFQQLQESQEIIL